MIPGARILSAVAGDLMHSSDNALHFPNIILLLPVRLVKYLKTD